MTNLSGFIFTETETPIPQLVISRLSSALIYATCRRRRRLRRPHYRHRRRRHPYFYLHFHLSNYVMFVAN